MRAIMLLGLLGLASCSGLYFDSPRPDVSKQTGPLTAPPEAVRNGTANDL